MLKWLLRVFGALVVVLGGLFWWLLLSGASASRSAPDLFPVADWRGQVAASPASARPSNIRLIEIASGPQPYFAAEAGAFGAEVDMAMTSFVIETPNGSIIVGGAVDQQTAEEMGLGGPGTAFHDETYQRLTEAMSSAERVLITHEHLDHVMAIARHPAPASLERSLYLNASQKTALGQFGVDGELDPALGVIPPRLSGGTEMIAPGVVIAPAAGHTDGSQVVFVVLQDGREYLLVGDIVWAYSNIENLKMRPLLTQFVVFEPNEDRARIRQQVRALHDLVAAEPELIVLPSHDRAHLRALVGDGSLQDGFAP